MADDVVLERIAGWERDALIDTATADRLRAAEGPQLPGSMPTGAASLGSRPGGKVAQPGFGLNLDVGEAFAYLGSFFVLGAWYWFISQAARDVDRSDWIFAAGALAPAVAFGFLGLVLAEAPGRIGRSAGLWFLLSGVHAFVGAPLLMSALLPAETFAGRSVLADYKIVFGGVVWVVCAVAFRARLASIPTDLGLIGAIVTLAASAVDRIGHLVAPRSDVYDSIGQSGNAIPWMLIALLGTVVATVGIGLLARTEARSLATDPGAGRRLAIARGSAGATLAIGTAFATLTGIGGFGRPVPPVIGDLLLLVVAIGLSALALNRRAAGYIYPAGLAVLIAFTDLNGEYLASGIGVGPALLVEGIVLIGVGFATQRGRRFVGRADIDGPAGPGMAASRAAPSPD
jgi:hypothetical protein